MHADFSHRITQLICSADSISPEALKSELHDLIRHREVESGDGFLIRTVCDRLEGAVVAVFGPLALMLVMTEPRRRQVYFAVLARLEADGALDAPGLDEAAQVDLLSRLVLSRNEDLITQVYGSCPPGFLQLVGRFGDCAREREIYTGLFRLLDAHPDLAQPLLAASETGPLTDDQVALAHALPPTAVGIRAAARFETMEEYRQLMRTYRAITGKAQLSEAHLCRIAEGEAAGKLLWEIYLALPFPPPVLAASDLTHVSNGLALRRSAQRFSDGFAHFVAEALTNERQFYIWRRPDAPEVMFAIDSDAPHGWYLSQAKLADKRRVPRELRDALHAMLEGFGVHTEGSVEKLMSPYQDGDDWFEIHELFAD